VRACPPNKPELDAPPHRLGGVTDERLAAAQVHAVTPVIRVPLREERIGARAK